jgi:hypothetical protein
VRFIAPCCPPLDVVLEASPNIAGEPSVITISPLKESAVMHLNINYGNETSYISRPSAQPALARFAVFLANLFLRRREQAADR